MRLIHGEEECSLMWTANYRIRFWLAFFAILLSTLLPIMRFTVAVAEEPITFVDIQPPEAFENEDYAWNITIKGGKLPYTCNLTGVLPPGLFLDAARCAISGKPLKGAITDKHTFSIKVADSSNRPLSAEASFTITLQYRSNIAITSALSAGETNVYVDGQQVAKLGGGQKISRIFPAGTKHTITVDTSVLASSKDEVRLRPVIDKIVVDGLSPDATFDYSSEYNINVKGNQPGIPTLPGSGWYTKDSPLNSAALAQIEPKPGTQYRFSYWKLPTGEVNGDTNLSWRVTKPGDVIATYDTYYQLTVNSEHCEVVGSGWYKAGTKARWNIKCAQSITAPGFWGHLGVQLEPEPDTGTVLMDAPKEVDIVWKRDYSKITMQVIGGLVAATVIAILSLLKRRIKRIVARL